MTTTPFFFVFEGLDGSGKSTQVRAVADQLREGGWEVCVTREPSDGPVGAQLRRWIGQKTEGFGAVAESMTDDALTLALLFAADRQDHLRRVVLPALQQRSIVLCDRYVPSSLAYQGLDGALSRVIQVNASFPVPAWTFFYMLAPQAAFDRLRKRDPEGQEGDAFSSLQRLQIQEKGYRLAMDLLHRCGWPILPLDANAPERELTEQVFDIILQSVVSEK